MVPKLGTWYVFRPGVAATIWDGPNEGTKVDPSSYGELRYSGDDTLEDGKTIIYLFCTSGGLWLYVEVNDLEYIDPV